VTKEGDIKEAKIMFMILNKLPGPRGRNHHVLYLILSLFILSSSVQSFPSETIDLSSTKSVREDKFNLLLITIDTLRADRLSCYSPEHVKTPNIDGLASKGVLFTRAFSNTTTTLPSHTNILLGTLPLFHGVHNNNNFVVRDEFTTLAEHLKKFGYETGAFVGAFPLDSRFGLNQGFDIYDDEYGIRNTEKPEVREREGQIVVDKAQRWLSQRKSSWFLWIHCYDPHAPYEPPEPFKTQYEKNPYDGEVAYIDFVMGNLIDYLEKNNLLKNTLIVFTGDHGESLGEHGEKTHGCLAYNAVIQVPLIIYGPKIKPRKVQHNVSHIDIFPTVCEVLDVDKPSFLQGISLLPFLKGKKLRKQDIYFESLSPYYTMGWAPIRGYIYDKEKYIDSPIPELYDLKKDFDEVKNLAERKKIEKYRKHLDQIIHLHSSERTEKAERILDRESIQKLKSLGYIGSYQEKRKETFGSEDDAKILLLYHNKSAEALLLCNEGKVRRAVEMLKEVITEKKNISLAYTNLAYIYKKLERLNDAIEVLKIGHKNMPTSYPLFSKYINYLHSASRADEIIKVFEGNDYLQKEYAPVILNIVGVSYWETGDIENAQRYYEKSIAANKNFPLPYNNLATLYSSIFNRTKNQNAYEKSIQYYKKAIDLDPYFGGAHNDLGVIYLQGGNLSEAISNFERALELQPDLYEVLYHLGLAYVKKNNKVLALSFFNRYKASPIYHLLKTEEKTRLEKYIRMCSSRPIKK
jgi:arylsulfatase A-like enzyme/Tfp pilus assembly protein PilF